MSRLYEALQRAGALRENAVELRPDSAALADVPSTWRLDVEDAPTAPSDVNPLGQLDLNAENLVVSSSPVEKPGEAAFGQIAPPGGRPYRYSSVAEQAVAGLHEVVVETKRSVTDSQGRGINSAEAEKLVVGPAADGIVVEQYRRLAAALHHAQRDRQRRPERRQRPRAQVHSNVCTVMITSAVDAEGRTLTATNLALTLSHSYQGRVLLIDADLRRPAIHKLLQLDNRIGLGDTLKIATSDRTLPVQQVSPMLWVLTAGPPDPDPVSGLVSDTMRQLLTEAAAQFDWILLDTPPVAVLPDANLLAAMVGTALLVVSANTTPYPLVMRAIERIGASRILGVVMNRAERSEIQDV